MSAIVKTIGSFLFQETEDYSIALKISGGYLSELTYSYSYKLTASSKNPTAKTDVYVLSDIGTTDLGVIPEGVLELAGRTQTAAMSAKSYALPVRREDNRI